MIGDSRERYDSIVMLKGIAILMVLTVHTSIYIDHLNLIIDQLTRIGRWGCQAFFVASGFTLTASWKRKSQSIGQFLARRYKTIAPYWYIAIVWFQVYAVLMNKYGMSMFAPINSNSINVLLSVFLLHGLSVEGINTVVPGGWYIGTQWLLYLMFPTCIKIYERWKKCISVKLIPLISLALSFLIQLMVAVIQKNPGVVGLYSFFQYSVITQLPCFLCGISLYYVFVEERSCTKSSNKYAINFCLLFGISSFGFYFLRNVPFIFVFVPTGFAVAFCFLFLTLETSKNKKGRIHAFLKCWGEVSHEAYYMNTVFTMQLPMLFFGSFKGFLGGGGTVIPVRFSGNGFDDVCCF